MPLERFIPKSPDPFIRNSQDFEVAKFGHLNTIIEYVNTYVVTDSLQLAGTGPLTSTARYITDSLGNASSLAISSGNIGIGTTNATARLRVISADTNGIVDLFQLDSSAAPLHLTRYGGNVPINLNTSGGTSTSPTPLGNGTAMSRISTNTYNGTAFGTSARIEVISKGIQSATNYGSNMRFFVTAENAISTSEVLSILSSGNVQINESFVTDRNAKLFIKGSGSTSATTSFLVQNSSSINTLQLNDDGTLYVGTTASNLGVIYVPHSPTYAQRTFLRMQSGGREIFATSSNDGLVVKTLGTTFEQTITINDGLIYGRSTAVATNVSAYNLPTQINCFSTANSCLINLSGGGRLQGSSDAQYIRIEGTIQLDGVSNELKGFYFNPTLTGAFSPQNVLAIHSTYGGAYLNTATPQASAILQADSTTQGFLPPRMTTTQRTGIVLPAAGLIVYDTDTNKSYTYDGTAWQAHW